MHTHARSSTAAGRPAQEHHSGGAGPAGHGPAAQRVRQQAIDGSPRMAAVRATAPRPGLPAQLRGVAPAPPLAAAPLSGRAPVQRQAGPVVQRLQKHAQAYANKNGLKLKTTYDAVVTYVANTANPTHLREGLRKAWNSQNRGERKAQFIPQPTDLVPAAKSMDTTDNFTGWDSEEEDGVDIAAVVKKQKTGTVRLIRSGKTPNVSGVPKLSLSEAIKLGRQIVKRDQYRMFLPFFTQIGPTPVEFNSPGTKDIYATPLKRKRDDAEDYQRAGASQSFNFDNLTTRLEQDMAFDEDDSAQEKEAKRRRKVTPIFDAFTGGETGELTEAQAEAIGAVACDLMKGSGAMDYVERARAAAQTDANFRTMFTGDDPRYAPSATGGRSLATARTPRRKARRRREQIAQDAQSLLNVNNCLINAIAQASLSRNATLAELVTIRAGLNNLGEMLVANAATVTLIIQTLHVPESVIVHYTLADGGLNETPVEGEGEIHIYHTGEDHFEAVCPDEDDYVLYEEDEES